MSTEILDIRKAKAKNSDNIAVFVLTSKKHQNHHSQPHNMKGEILLQEPSPSYNRSGSYKGPGLVLEIYLPSSGLDEYE